MRRAALVPVLGLLVAGLLLAASPHAALAARGELRPEIPAEGALARPDPLQNELEQVAVRFAAGWGRGSADAVAGLLSAGGIRLRLEGVERSALPARQASAVIRDFLKGYDAGEARVVRAAPVAGNPGRGFAEIRWQTRVAGTSHPVAHVVFLGLVREGNGWRVDELRLLP
jgi:hypothetical protein